MFFFFLYVIIYKLLYLCLKLMYGVLNYMFFFFLKKMCYNVEIGIYEILIFLD